MCQPPLPRLSPRGAAPASSAAASLMNKGAIVFVLIPPTPGGGFGATFPRVGRGFWAELC